MWWTNSLCTFVDEDLGTLAEYDPLTSEQVADCLAKNITPRAAHRKALGL